MAYSESIENSETALHYSITYENKLYGVNVTDKMTNSSKKIVEFLKKVH
jgi:hypothetical protein